MRNPKSILAVLAAGLLALSSCAAQKGNPPLRTERLTVGPAQVTAEIARTPGERELGLMFRKALPDGAGMLFVFDTDERLSFWMKNTLVPLSIAYISSDGTIREILDMEPRSLAPVPSQYSVRYALEVPQGWFSRAGVRVGDRVILPDSVRSR
ncbi:MAG TPA: DUF192 domain-containing protein [Spirochaetia bacterium]|nr:DUF192 domain-containing protein [Spirochaetales bacterium]HRY80364.1 DUF192 domain-containing protein [Spirochaetia bacterium]